MGFPNCFRSFAYLSAAVRAPRHADHLGADPDAPGVQRLDRHFVSHAHLTHHARCRDLAALEDQLARARGADAELILFLADAESPEASIHREGGDPFVALGEVAVREHDEQPGLRAVRDPQLASLEDPAAPAPPPRRAGLEPER